MGHPLFREGNGTPLQCSCLENPRDGGAWWAAVHGVAKSRTQLSDFIFTFHFHALEKEMATHSSVLAWRIPGMGEPGGLPSMGSHRVWHYWSDLIAAGAATLFYGRWSRAAVLGWGQVLSSAGRPGQLLHVQGRGLLHASAPVQHLRQCRNIAGDCTDGAITLPGSGPRRTRRGSCHEGQLGAARPKVPFCFPSNPIAQP